MRTVVGLDLNSTRARAATAGQGQSARALSLDARHAELPLALALDGRVPEVGERGLTLRRKAPHSACVDFLPSLGERRHWGSGRSRIDANRALELVFARLHASLPEADTLALALPAYLTREQIDCVPRLAEKAGLPSQLWLSASLAAALTAAAEHPWDGAALVLDADDHALTGTVVEAGEGSLRILDVQALPRCGANGWKEVLLKAACDRCVRQTRRDPRDSAEAEQSLYDQLDAVLDGCGRGEIVDLVVHMTGLCQNLLISPVEAATRCAPFVERVLAEMNGLLNALPGGAPCRVVLVTASASRLPGLVGSLHEAVAGWSPTTEDDPDEDDFGAGLLDDESMGRVGVCVLPADAIARGACELAARRGQGEATSGYLSSAPLPPPLAPDAGPARVQFRNQDYAIQGKSFLIGRHTDCDLVLDPGEYPAVSGRHCEIIYERRTFVLRDRSRNGTFVNDRPVIHEIILQPGDWIRLGPGGPLVRFLGRSADQLQLITTA
jgi:hypothetical protein